MSLHWAPPGEFNVGNYQVSSIPYLTSSQLSAGETREIQFPRVTRFVFLQNNSAAGNTIAMGFTENGTKGNPTSNTNNFVVAGGGSVKLDLRLKSLFLSASAGTAEFSLVAGLTEIQPEMLGLLSGSRGYKGIG